MNNPICIFLGLSICLFFSRSLFADVNCQQLDGAKIVADDGQYLGRIASKFEPDSIFNNIGQYGNELSSNSIWNELGKYGNELSSQSAFSQLASNPPLIIKNEQKIGYLTINEMKTNAVDPIELADTCYGIKIKKNDNL